jgi:hypothetical protein
VLRLGAVHGAPVLFADDVRIASFLDELLNALPELAGEASVNEVRWLGKVAVVLAAGLPQWPSRYSISKYIDYLGPSLSRELAAAFFDGQEDAFDQIRKIDAPGMPVAELGARLATWVAEQEPPEV